MSQALVFAFCVRCRTSDELYQLHHGEVKDAELNKVQIEAHQGVLLEHVRSLTKA